MCKVSSIIFLNQCKLSIKPSSKELKAMNNQNQTNTGRNTTNEFERNKMILQGRVYPAIQSCVNNRYKIILGIFAYYAFIFSSGRFTEDIRGLFVNFLVSVIFTIFLIHNLVNYWLNNNEKCELEKKCDPEKKRESECPTMEIIFFVSVFILIWGAFYIVIFVS